MSLYAADAFGYLQQVEAYFLSLSRIGVMLSSKDAELMRHYRDGLIPVEIVCLGIKRAFQLYEEAPRSIYQCRHIVEDEIKAWRARSAGSHEPAVERAPGPGTSSLPGRELPDPTDPRRRDRKRQRRRPQPGPANVVRGLSDAVHVRAPRLEREEHRGLLPPLSAREGHLMSWYKSMERLIALGRSSDDEHVRRAYRWAWRQMHSLKQEALECDDEAHVASVIPLAVGEIEAAMYDQLFNALHPDLRKELEDKLPPQMRRSLRGMSPAAARRQMRVWRRRMLEEMLGVVPFFTP